MNFHTPKLIPEAPHLEDRWEDQVALEQEMLATGRTRMQDRINRARDKKDMTRMRPYRSLIKEFVEPVAENLRVWVETSGKRRGPKPIALPLLATMEPEACALIALRTIFRMLGVERRMLNGMAMEIGTWIEHEVRSQEWIKADPDMWAKMEYIYGQRGSNAAHIKRSRVSIFNKHIAEKIGYQAWADEQRRRVGLQMIDCVVQGTGRFKVVLDRSSATKKAKTRKATSWPQVLEADPELLDWLASAMDDELVFWPVYMPTIIKPRPWEGPKDGGYWTPFIRSPFLVRFRASHEEQRQRAIDEYMSLDMPLVYESINFVQDTGWRINKRVLEVAQYVREKGLPLGKIPVNQKQDLRARPETEDKEIMDQWREEASITNTYNAKLVARVLTVKRTLDHAERMSCEPAFWFPHMLDFRSRMYPIPSDLSPQGNDLHHGLLEFSEGKALGEHGSTWLAIHLANQFGMEKKSFQERIDWVTANHAMWLAIEADPIADRRWAEADGGENAWQALAAAIEYANYLKHGTEYVSFMPVRVDGTCNGIQHLSAMVRDRVGGASVNLLPAESPTDIYSDVAEELLEMLKARKGDNYADMWLGLFGDKVPRAVAKRPVMILPYGGTIRSYLEYTEEWLDEADPLHSAIPKEHRPKAIGYLSKLLWQAVNAKLTKAREVMDWLQKCSKRASSTGRPLYWVTPAGFVVRHFYGAREKKQIETKIDGQKLQIVNWEQTAVLDKQAQAKGIAPNFVHSMDASALMSCTILAKRAGITSMTTIHDSYGTHAADMWTLFECIREAFVQTYETPVLEDFLRACQEVAPEVEDWPEMPTFGDLDLYKVYEADYFFA